MKSLAWPFSSAADSRRLALTLGWQLILHCHQILFTTGKGPYEGCWKLLQGSIIGDEVDTHLAVLASFLACRKASSRLASFSAAAAWRPVHSARCCWNCASKAVNLALASDTSACRCCFVTSSLLTCIGNKGYTAPLKQTLCLPLVLQLKHSGYDNTRHSRKYGSLGSTHVTPDDAPKFEA